MQSFPTPMRHCSIECHTARHYDQGVVYKIKHATDRGFMFMYAEPVELLPLLLRWKRRVGAATFSTFSLDRKGLIWQQYYSDAASPVFPNAIRLGDWSLLQRHFAPNIAEHLILALEGRLAQFDFEEGILVLPIIYLERIRGVVVAIAPLLEVNQYSQLTDACKEIIFHIGQLCKETKKSIPYQYDKAV